MRFPLFMVRKVKPGRAGRNSLTSATIAVVGVSIAVIVMELAIAVVLGFKQEIKNKVSGFDAQVTVSPYVTGEISTINDIYLSFNDTLGNVIESTVPGVKATLSLKQPGILKTDNDFAGVLFKGYGANHGYEFEKSNIVEGCIPDYSVDENKNKIVISRLTANSLKLGVGDKINTYFFTNENLRARKFEVAGIYDSKFSDYDRLIAYASLPVLQRVAGIDTFSGSAIELRGITPDSIVSVSDRLQQQLITATYARELSRFYEVNNITRSAAIYFNWLDLLDTNVVVILILMACVAGITLVSCLFIMILERVKMIGLLKALGATNAQIRRVFIYLAQRLVLRGVLIGNAVAIGAISLQAHYRIIPLDPDAYYLSYVPVEINPWDFLALNIGVIIVSVLILIIPSHIASNISPTQTMRYE